MAHIFKYPQNKNKGIIVFTHKEYLWIFKKKINFKIKNLLKKNNLEIIDILRYLRSININIFLNIKNNFEYYKIISKITSLSSKYYIGIHWGGFTENPPSAEWVNFHLTKPSITPSIDEKYIIPLQSANFTPEVMKPKKTDKYWDIVCVARNSSIKNYPKLMDSIRNIYDLGYKYKVIFIIASTKNKYKNKKFDDILENYFSNFSSFERENFTIIKTDPDTGFQGFSYTFLSHIYNQSKVFTLFSQEEGASKVIKEALLCGVPVVVKKDLRGGGRDYLDNENSMTFSDYENAHKTLIEAVESFNNFKINTEDLKSIIGETASLGKLKEYFSKMYKENGENFDGDLINTDNLNRRLPAHLYEKKTIKWAANTKYRFDTTDITNYDMFNKFYNCCIGDKK